MPNRVLRHPLASCRAGRAALGATGALCFLTLIALALLWPTGHSRAGLAAEILPIHDKGQVTQITASTCINVRFTGCRRISVKADNGPLAGRTLSFQTGEDGRRQPLGVGDAVSLVRQRGDFTQGAPRVQPYTLGDPHRRFSLIYLFIGFCAAVGFLGGRKGVLALAGMALSLLLVFLFAVPAILDGRPPVLVALAAVLSVMLISNLLAHGVTAMSLAAVLGTAASLVLTTGLAVAFVAIAHLTGSTSQDATLLQFSSGGQLSLTGLVLAGILIGALGVLMDVTISQASSVIALRRADPHTSARGLYRAAAAIGRDHVAATVQTLVLAYVGASLPVLLVFGVGGVSLGTALDQEDIAEQVVGTLVGSIGLVAAVPITTALAAALAVRLPHDGLTGEHTHAH